jgi:hypothetical protein
VSIRSAARLTGLSGDQTLGRVGRRQLGSRGHGVVLLRDASEDGDPRRSQSAAVRRRALDLLASQFGSLATLSPLRATHSRAGGATSPQMSPRDMTRDMKSRQTGWPQSARGAGPRSLTALIIPSSRSGARPGVELQELAGAGDEEAAAHLSAFWPTVPTMLRSVERGTLQTLPCEPRGLSRAAAGDLSVVMCGLNVDGTGPRTRALTAGDQQRGRARMETSRRRCPRSRLAPDGPVNRLAFERTGWAVRGDRHRFTRQLGNAYPIAWPIYRRAIVRHDKFTAV